MNIQISSTNNIFNMNFQYWTNNCSLEDALNKNYIKSGSNMLLIFSSAYILDLVEICSVLIDKVNLFIVIDENYFILFENMMARNKNIKNILDIINIINIEDYLKGEYDYMKGDFDYLPANPPYGNLHYKIFNKSMELLKPNGEAVFIQPASPYNGKNTTISEKQMVSYLNDNTVHAQIRANGIFQDASFGTDLAITHIVKDNKQSGSIDTIKYIDDEIYYNVDIKNISMNGVNPSIFESILNKYKEIIKKNGSLHDIVLFQVKKPFLDNMDKNFITISTIRGHLYENGEKKGHKKADFYTFFSDKDPSKTENRKHGLLCKKGQEKNMYIYLTSKFARYGLSILKTNSHIDGNLKLIPQIDFSKDINDSDLYKLINLTDEEISCIENTIPLYDHKLGLHFE